MKHKLGLFLVLPLLFCGACSEETIAPNNTNESESGTALKEFSNAKFVNKTFTYDGQPHSIVVTGVPTGTDIAYTNNVQTKVGRYKATAKLTKNGYKEKTLSAYITIKENLLEFEGLVFASETVNYDGQPHSLVVTGAPEGSTITYSINCIDDVGTYPITATVSKEGYVTKTLTATLTIKGKTFTGVTFSNETFKFDGLTHSIFVEFENKPEGTLVVYSGNGKSSKGTYTVTATITAPGYEKLVLTATMTISDVREFPDCQFSDFYYIYDGKDINLKLYFESYEYTLAHDTRVDYSVVYKVNGVAKTDPVIKNVGVYTVSATYSANKYVTKTFSFKITISDTIAGVDTTKTPFQFTQDTKFDDLYAEMKKSNYSMSVESFDEYDRDRNGTYEEVVKNDTLIHNFFVTSEAMASRHNEDSTRLETEDYYITKGSNYALVNHYEYFESYKEKFPAQDYLENVIEISGGMIPFTLLKKSESGGFENSKVGGYVDEEGSFEIDSVNNRLIITGKLEYFHPDFNHIVGYQYTFYNVGNTKVNIPEALRGKDSEASSYEMGSFTRNGISYQKFDEGYRADVTLDEADDLYLGGGGTYTLEAVIEGFRIYEIDYNYYWDWLYVDHSKYQINVYYNDDGYYQEPYDSYGYVNYFKDAQKFGNLYYYGEW